MTTLKNISRLAFGFGIILLSACSLPDNYFVDVPECSTGDDSYQQASVEDQMKLVKDSKSTDFRYFFQEFKEEGDDVLMKVNFRNDTKCFDLWMLVNKWDKLQGMYDHKGEGYPKELFDLTWHYETGKNGDRLRFEDMHEVID